jgi:hypothetical protein
MNYLIWILKDGPLIFDMVLSQCAKYMAHISVCKTLVVYMTHILVHKKLSICRAIGLHLGNVLYIFSLNDGDAFSCSMPWPC